MFAIGDFVNYRSLFNFPSYVLYKFTVCVLSLFCHSHRATIFKIFKINKIGYKKYEKDRGLYLKIEM